MSEELCEVVECFGCGGDVAEIDAILLPDNHRAMRLGLAHPHCSRACYVTNTCKLGLTGAGTVPYWAERPNLPETLSNE